MNSRKERTREETVGRGPPGSNAGDIAVWISKNGAGIADRWRDEIRARGEGIDEGLLHVIGELLALIVSLLPTGLSARREQAEGILRELAELYGTLGAHRGLAAGEAVEEVQLLREVLLRFLYGQAGPEAPLGLDLRDVLQLNRLIDLIVTFASVGHTDRLFFSLMDGPGTPTPPDDDFVSAFREQIEAFRDDAVELATA